MQKVWPALAGTSLLAIYPMSLAAQEVTPAAPNAPLVSPQVQAQAPAASQSASESREDTGIGDIIVTASRRETTIKDTPTAVSAYSGDQLRDAQINNLRDLAATTPNVQFGSFSTNANVSIRGIGNTQLTLGSDAGVAFHVDGVYLGQTALAGSNFLDINRVEILRGPQGTLFGRNATGGAVNLIPNLPTRDLTGGADVSVGFDPKAVRATGYVSGPLTEGGNLRARVAILKNYNEGFTRNLDPTGPNHLDDLNTFAVRGQLQWDVTPGFDVRVSIEHQDADDNGPAIFNVGTAALSGQQPLQLAGAALGSIDRREVANNVGARHVNTNTALVAANLDLAGGNLRALYSYNWTKQFVAYEDDGTAVDFARSFTDQTSHQHFAELLYTSAPKRPFTFVVGTNYFREDFRQFISVFASNLPITVDLGGNLKTTSYAAFGQAQYTLAPGLRAFAGLRYTHDKKDIDEFNVFIGTAQQQKSFSKVTYEAGLSYDFSRAITGYAKYATGFKGGGFAGGNLAPAFNPETNDNIEVGLKGNYLDGLLSANVSAFRMKYNDLQVNQIRGVVASITNAAKATIRGVEVETVLRPARGFRIEASGAYLDATFDDFLTEDSARPSLGTLQLSGNRLPQAPEVTASIGAFQDVHTNVGVFTIGGRYDWKARNYFTEFNLPVASQAPVGKADLSIKYRSVDGHFNASAYVLNVSDEKIRSNVLVVSAILGSIGLASLNPGRQIGFSFGFDF